MLPLGVFLLIFDACYGCQMFYNYELDLEFFSVKALLLDFYESCSEFKKFSIGYLEKEIELNTFSITSNLSAQMGINFEYCLKSKVPLHFTPIC